MSGQFLYDVFGIERTLINRVPATLKMSLRFLIFGLVLPVLAPLHGGCSKDPSVGCFNVEIAPAKFVPVQFNRKFRTDMRIRYHDQTVLFKLPRSPNSASTLMEFEGRLYVLALDASSRDTRKWLYRCYQQDGTTFKEISAKDFPRSIAIMNLFRPGIPGRYSTGMEGQTIDAAKENRELDPEDVYFVNSWQANLWYMLEVENNFDKARKDFSGAGAKKFLQEYIKKYQPVRLTSMEMKPVPKGGCKF